MTISQDRLPSRSEVPTPRPSRAAGWVTRVPFGWRMMTPLLVLLAIFVVYPVCYSFYLSLTGYRLTSQDPYWVGIQQYEKVLQDGDFIRSLGLTMIFVAIAVTLELVLGMILALALQRQTWARNAIRALLFTPMFIAPVAVGLIFKYLLNEQLGLLPSALEGIGINIDFFGPGTALITLALIDVWQWTPFMVLLLLAGLESRPKSPYEAARVDGASEWLTFRTLTLPMMWSVISVAVIVRVLEASKLFEYVYVITNGGPGGQTESLQFLMYQTGIRFFRLGEASAMAFLFLLILLVPIVLLFRQLKKEEES